MTSTLTSRSAAVKWTFNFLIPLIILLLPESEAFSWNIKVFIAITAWAVIAYAMEMVDNLIISLILIFMYGLSGIAPLNAVLAPWTADVAWITLGALILVAIVSKTTILKRMAYLAVIRTNGSYMLLVLAFFTLSILARIFLQGTMACLVVIFLSFAICEALGLGKSRASAGLIMATTIAYMDACFYLYTPDFIAILYNAAAPVKQIVQTYPEYFKDNAVFLLGNYLVAFAIGVFGKPQTPLSNRDVFVEKLKELGSLTATEKKVILVLAALVIFLFTNQYHHIPMVYGFIFAPALLFMPGINAGSKQHLKEVQYPVLFFIIACMSIGFAGNAVGFGDFVSATITPKLQGISQTMFLVSTYVISVLLNFLMTPLAEVAALGLPFAQICADLNFSLQPMFYVLFQGTYQAWMPYEIATYLVAFSLGYIYLKDFVWIMTIKFVIQTVFLATAGVAWWSFIGIL